VELEGKEEEVDVDAKPQVRRILEREGSYEGSDPSSILMKERTSLVRTRSRVVMLSCSVLSDPKTIPMRGAWMVPRRMTVAKYPERKRLICSGTLDWIWGRLFRFLCARARRSASLENRRTKGCTYQSVHVRGSGSKYSP
jgi:hypothetical protein